MNIRDRTNKIIEIDRIHSKLEKDFGKINRWHIVHSEKYRVSNIADEIDEEVLLIQQREIDCINKRNKINILIFLYLIIVFSIIISGGIDGLQTLRK